MVRVQVSSTVSSTRVIHDSSEYTINICIILNTRRVVVCILLQILIYVYRIHVAMEASVSQSSTTTYAYVDLVTAVSDATIVSRVYSLLISLTDKNLKSAHASTLLQ